MTCKRNYAKILFQTRQITKTLGFSVLRKLNSISLQSGRSKYKTGVVSFLLCMTYHADITLTYFCIYNEFVTPILKTFVFLSRYPIYRLKPLMNNLRTLATHIDRRKLKIKIFCGRKIFMKSGPSFQHFHKKSHQKCHAILLHS